jgi:hypothetical protein
MTIIADSLVKRSAKCTFHKISRRSNWSVSAVTFAWRDLRYQVPSPLLPVSDYALLMMTPQASLAAEVVALVCRGSQQVCISRRWWLTRRRRYATIPTEILTTST